jgi:hypothetical protein
MRYVVAATLSLLALHCSSEEPVRSQDGDVVENHPGTLAITSPARASFVEGDGAPIEVKGTGATRGLTIDGAPAEVSPDGSFRATIKPTPGLNVIVAVDGEARLEAPFVYGRYARAGTPVAQAIGVDLGAEGIGAAAPTASLTSIANGALGDRDLLEPIRGKKLSGNVLGSPWSFTVTGGRHSAASIALAAKTGGLGVTASVGDLVVDGSVTVLGTTRNVTVTADRATITGDTQLSIDPAKGTLKVAMPSADAKLEGFGFDAGNGTIDDILAGFVQPLIEQTIRDGLRDQVPSALQRALDRLAFPKELDLSKAGLSKPIALETRFDGVVFDPAGGTLTVSALFGGAFAPGTPGAEAPGYLKLAQRVTQPRRGRSIGVSFSLDAVNQLLFAAWGDGSLSFSVPAPVNAKLTPRLPPIVSVTDAGVLRVGLGEIIVERAGETPMAAVTVLQDLAPGSDDQGLVLAPQGEPTLSITWLNETAAAGGKLIAAAAKDQIGNVLKPIRIPLPKISLEALGPAYKGQSIAITSPKIAVDKTSARLTATGTMTFVK